MEAMEWKEILSSLRKERGLTQAELAAALGVSRQTVSRWELGLSTPSADNLIALSRVYEMTVEEMCRKRDGRGADVLADEGEQETAKAEIPGSRRSRKKWIAAGIVVCFCGGTLLWGKLTNSMTVAKVFLEALAALAFWGLLAYAAIIVIIKFGKDVKKRR